MDDVESLIGQVRSVARSEPGVVALLLTGSRAQGVHDDFSDVDFVLVAKEGRVVEVADRWAARRPFANDLAYDNRLDLPGSVLFNQTTTARMRFDVVVTTEPDLGRRSQATVRALHDPTGLYARLPESNMPPEPTAEVAERLVPEFFRVLSLTSVVLGREDYAVGVSGAMLLRSMLIEALSQRVSVEDRGGVLHLKRLLAPQDYRVVTGIPPIEATRESVAQANRYCAQHFIAAARELCDRTGYPWPDEYISRVAQHTQPLIGTWLDGPG